MKLKISPVLNKLFHNREASIFLPIYFFISLNCLVLKLRLTPSWIDGTLIINHKSLMAFTYYNNEQSRLFQFLIPELISRIFPISIITSYAFARFTFVFLSFVVFHFFLRKWFSSSESFAGVLILSASIAIAFLSSDLQESAPLLMLLFVLGLWALREKKDLLFCFLLVLGGGFTNETMLVMPAGYFFYRLPSRKMTDVLKTALTTLLLALPAFLIQGGIRYINRNQPHLGDVYQLPANILGIWNEIKNPIDTLFHGNFLYLFLIFSIFWIYAIFGYKKSPHFLKAMFWIVPFFLVAHMITGKINESRQMIPLGFIIIPMSFFIIFPKRSENTT